MIGHEEEGGSTLLDWRSTAVITVIAHNIFTNTLTKHKYTKYNNAQLQCDSEDLQACLLCDHIGCMGMTRFCAWTFCGI